jgi:hypothetical protein
MASLAIMWALASACLVSHHLGTCSGLIDGLVNPHKINKHSCVINLVDGLVNRHSGACSGLVDEWPQLPPRLEDHSCINGHIDGLVGQHLGTCNGLVDGLMTGIRVLTAASSMSSPNSHSKLTDTAASTTLSIALLTGSLTCI